MNEAQGAAATGESDEATPPPSAANAAPPKVPERAGSEAATTGQQPSQPTRLGALLEGLELPPEVLATVTPKGQEEGEKKEGEEEAGDTPATTDGEQEQEAEIPGTTPPAAEAAEEEEHVPEEWPQSAKARVAQEAEKRRKWKANAEQLYAELQKQQSGQAQQQPTIVPAPTPDDPLANVLDFGTLQQIQADWQEILDFAEDNPEGAYDVLVGKDAQGNDRRKDYSADDIKEMKRRARPILRAVPGRAQYLQTLIGQAQETLKIYPEMFQQGSQLNQDASYILSVVPEVRRSPDFLIWLGDALAGRKMRLAKNGQQATASGKPLSPQAQAILKAPKVTPAPGVIKSRSHEGSRQVRGGVDTKQAREDFAKSDFSPEGLEDYVAALRRSQRAGEGPKQRTLV